MANKAKAAAKRKAREDAAHFESAGINFRPSWKQHLAWQALEDGTTEEVMYGGAAGGGKSYLGASWKVYRRLRYDDSRGVTARTRLIDIKESTLVTYFKVLAEWGLVMGQDYRYISRSGAPEALVFNNGSREIFKELAFSPADEDYQRLGSLEITDVWIEEANDGVPEKGADILKSRIRWKLAEFGLIPKMLITCNPGYTWVRLKYVYDKENNPVQLKPYQRVIQALVTDNPDREFVRIYKKSLEQLKPYDRQRLLEGDWNAVEKTGGEFYPSYDTERHVGDYTYDPGLALHITFDFNLTPYVTLNVWQVQGKVATQIDEFCQHGKTSLACQAFMRKYGSHRAEVFVYGDPAGKHGDTRTEQGSNDYTIVVKELKKLPKVTLRVEASAPSVSMRGLWIDELLEQDGQAPADKPSAGGIVLRFDRKCNVTSTDYQKVKKASDGTKEKKKVMHPTLKISYEPYGHPSDANDYFLCRCFKAEWSAYQRQGSNKPAVGDRSDVHQRAF
ncbi:phage terminase large subunit [Hymenobacter sp. 15J16-1T3B]|uniref:phage terminase large subunit n=1 Tax=Hymenobacter sp. 15J16-1T3B TaxID=2886941 RepID=UPI001D11AC98|nr:phage terminase large subunit [Hymenobacter sp. 15J16-1T3B]MCC3159508.1 phage terminase large subunit [Hymenobacter sp. 15J16-1T3B]